MSQDTSALFTLAVLFSVYFAPSLITVFRGRRNRGSVIVVNLFLGWTFIGWVVALAMAFGGQTDKQVDRDLARFR